MEPDETRSLGAARRAPRRPEIDHDDLAMQRGELQGRSVEVDEPDLEAVFLHLTGKALRDAGG